MKQKNNLAVPFNHTYRHIDDDLSIKIHNFHNHVHLIYPNETEIKNTTESGLSASYLDIPLKWQSYIYIIYMTSVMTLILQSSTFHGM
jgi:hypothetical protein